MKPHSSLAFVATCCLLGSACANGVNQSDMNYSININYGIVEAVNPVKVDSNAGGGAAMGGIIGAATSNHHKRGEHALVGAVAGGLLAAVMQGNREAYAYQINLASGGTLKVMTEQGDIRVGDCVSIEQGHTTNVRRVASVYCDSHGDDALQHPHVVSSAHEDAAECHTAKQIALKAETEEEIDIAIKRVRALCDG
ncbi:hypothetical protein [Gilvimarinus agarilyticus]|uniref:hypothetical protein n=1 Tax=Gilvimarinus agarilyticus TaxID=679259 RepID=UPI0005A253E5|nr:hypothetical protein [Gilvimarinus agarilyticus]